MNMCTNTWFSSSFYLFFLSLCSIDVHHRILDLTKTIYPMYIIYILYKRMKYPP